MTRQEAEAIYDAGKKTGVRVLLDMDRRIHALECQVQDLSARLDTSERRSGSWKNRSPRTLTTVANRRLRRLEQTQAQESAPA